MSYWIFQTRADVYRLPEALSALGDDWVWEVNQHAKDIHAGDEVLLWQSGDKAGAYALATVTSDPEMLRDQGEFWIDRTRGENPSLRVRLRVLRRFPETPLLRSALLGEPALEGLSILRFAQGTNFHVSPEEWDRLKELLPRGQELTDDD